MDCLGPRPNFKHYACSHDGIKKCISTRHYDSAHFGVDETEDEHEWHNDNSRPFVSLLNISSQNNLYKYQTIILRIKDIGISHTQNTTNTKINCFRGG